MTNDKSALVIDASPTKEFFIYMLVRDINLIRSIIDLVDNSIDGARKSRIDKSYKGLWVNVDINSKEFVIEDNCGGIEPETARNYAFRFGRPINAPETDNSIGQFGVGMKRTFFKLGEKFNVASKTKNSKFTMHVDVKDWVTRPEWNFAFETLEENIKLKKEETGTVIKVSPLHEEVSESFNLTNFVTRLEKEITAAHSEALSKGIVISVNGVALIDSPLSLLLSSDMKPAYKEIVFNTKGQVNVRIYAGLSNRDLVKGGWYIYCNGRVIVEADQTLLTGWGEDEVNSVPKYHPDFAYFRGAVFFDSKNPGLLPWTTTKTGVDSDSAIYVAVREEMISIMLDVLSFLRKLASEKAKNKDSDNDLTPLESSLNKATSVLLKNYKSHSNFISPKPMIIKKGPKMSRILYYKPEDEVKTLKKILSETTNKAVGEKTFEYFLYNESDI